MLIGQRTFSERSLHGKVAHELGRRILGGRFEPEEILPNEATICEELNVSRTALREAFKVLSAKGLIASKPKVGTRVNPRRFWNMLDPDVLTWAFDAKPSKALLQSLFDVRKVFEPAAAEMAARKGNDRLIAEIGEAYLNMENAIFEEKKLMDSDLQFHLSLLDATENEFIISLGTMIETALLGAFRFCGSQNKHLSRALSQHKEVYLGIKMADPERAYKAMSDLLVHTGKEVFEEKEDLLQPEAC